MDSYDKSCNPLKQAYDSCHKAWLHDEYLPLSSLPNSKEVVLEKFGAGFVPCEKLFKPYQECVQKALERDNIDLKMVKQNLLDRPLIDGMKEK